MERIGEFIATELGLLFLFLNPMVFADDKDTLRWLRRVKKRPKTRNDTHFGLLVPLNQSPIARNASAWVPALEVNEEEGLEEGRKRSKRDRASR